MRHRLHWFIQLMKGDEHPTNTPLGVWHTSSLALLSLWTDLIKYNAVRYILVCSDGQNQKIRQSNEKNYKEKPICSAETVEVRGNSPEVLM